MRHLLYNHNLANEWNDGNGSNFLQHPEKVEILRGKGNFRIPQKDNFFRFIKNLPGNQSWQVLLLMF